MYSAIMTLLETGTDVGLLDYSSTSYFVDKSTGKTDAMCDLRLSLWESTIGPACVLQRT